MYILQNCCEISDKPLFKGQVLLQDSTLGWVDICIFSRALTMKKHLKPYIDKKNYVDKIYFVWLSKNHMFWSL